MTTPQVGISHDVVIYEASANIDPIGIIVAPHSYRVGEAPTFVPRMAVGDQKGIDYSTLVSWVQSDWRGACGVDVPRPSGTMDWDTAIGLHPDLASGALRPIRPPIRLLMTRTSVISSETYLRAPSVVGIHTVGTTDEMSDARIFQGGAIFHPIVVGREGHSSSISLISHSMALLGPCRVAYDAVQLTTVAFVSTYGYSGGASKGFVTPIVGHVSDTVFLPASTTTGQALAVYDAKLWRSEPEGQQIAYYTIDAKNNTCTWSDWIETAAGEHIKRMEPFIGRLFIGTVSGLWVYEAGRTYQVVDFSADKSQYNFNFLLSAHGALWFNIGRSIYRYTSGGLLERMALELNGIPWDAIAGPDCIFVSTLQLGEIDDATVELLDNPTFNGNINNWSASDCGGKCTLAASYDTTHQRTGAGCADLAIDYDTCSALPGYICYAKFRSDAATVIEGAKVTISGWRNYARSSPSPVARLKLVLRFEDSSGGYVREYPLDIMPETGSYQFMELTETAPPGATKARLCVHVMSLVSTTNTDHLYLDDMSLIHDLGADVYRIDNALGSCQEVPNAGGITDGTARGVGLVMAVQKKEDLDNYVPEAPIFIVGPYAHSGELAFVNYGYPYTGMYLVGDTVGQNIVTSWITHGYPRLLKQPIRAKVDVSILAKQSLELEYQVPGGAWESLGVKTGLIEGPTTFEFDDVVVSERIRLRPTIVLPPEQQSAPEIRSIELDSQFINAAQPVRVGLTAIVTDDLELLSGVVENSAAYISASLYSLSGSGLAHVVALPYPPPVGHTIKAKIKIGPTGAHVPVLPTSYTSIPSGVPGATIPLTITEV